MLENTSWIFLIFLCIMIGGTIFRPFLSKDKSQIWSPITIISLVLIYYIVIPSFQGLTLYGAESATKQSLFYFMAVLFLGCILWAYKSSSPNECKKWNSYFTMDNAQRIAVVLFLITIVCYVPFRGFRTSIFVDDALKISARTGLVSYFIDLISLLVGASCLSFIGLKNIGKGVIKRCVIFGGILYFAFILFIVGGFRYRIVILLLALATTYHLFPKPRKINYLILVPVGVLAFLGFAVMDSSRRYGQGIDMEVAESVSLAQASQGAQENMDVCCFSIAVFDEYSRNGGYVGFEPVLTAVLMPIPRAILPSKPKGEYMIEAQNRTIGDALGGAAVLVFAEAYMSLGVFGVILYGLFIGWACKKVWINYRNSPNSIGAILLLALFNGFCYTWISRGYMAGAFNDFIYFVVLPFWITALLRKYNKA